MISSTVESCGSLYLDLLKRSLTNSIYGSQIEDGFDQQMRDIGIDWPRLAHTMIGKDRLDNLHGCVETVLREGVAGDLIETGVWRGGASILMRGVLKAYGVSDRYVWLADSFRGLPPPDERHYPADAGSTLHYVSDLAISLGEVRANFERYGLLDDQVRFLEGWFRDTLPAAPIDRLALIRLDGDLYESTMDGLVHLYPRLSQGGYVIVDDYALPACAQAVQDYRHSHAIREPIQTIDWTGVYWRCGQ